MLPFIFEWIWDMSHMVFMGGALFALTVTGIGMTYCVVKAVVDSTNKEKGSDH